MNANLLNRRKAHGATVSDMGDLKGGVPPFSYSTEATHA
jgi:hypothetical protein